MSKLRPLPNTELSEYCLNILAKHDIHSVGEFIKETTEKLMKILNLNAGQIQKIKSELKRIYGPVRVNLAAKFRNADEDLRDSECVASFSLYDEKQALTMKSNSKCYYTLIGPLDDLLAPMAIVRNSEGNRTYSLGPSNLTSKMMWEICGPTSVGKTQLALTIMCNFIQLHQREVLYVDTKMDFCATRVKNILTSRQLKKDVIAGTLEAIKVERVLSAQGLVEMLNILYLELRNGSDCVKNIRLIVIDSLPAVWFLLKSDVNRLAGKCLLSRLVQILYRICDEFQIGVICVNLSIIPQALEEQQKQQRLGSLVPKNEHDISDILEDDDIDMEQPKQLAYRQVMGNFWLSKPRLRLSMEYISEEERELRKSQRRILKVMQSNCMDPSGSCFVRICDQGVV
ncbi:DNA repair protein RAD51 homolog 2 [Musca vetustissima]|uniref:DNA repair protein RAD51 homolog 2 n=1 Tax=Musca vetustissima TaxID=27455 RepID=UPI002AB78491|nr:DNA repair protein RAD51 homolog 2 [Musca vetustissima]